MDQNENDELQNLYQEFESEIVKAGNTEAFFDETDLVEVFDRASDLNNSIVKMEVLLYGERHYPGSEALATRRAWFYSDFGDLEAATSVNSRVANEGVLNRLLKLRVAEVTDSTVTEKALDEIIDGAESFAEEDLIQLVDFCADCNLLEWIHSRRDRVLDKTRYAQTFIYELALLYEENGDYGKAVPLFEELTMSDPFALDFWLKLAGSQYGMNDFENVLSSADYALAIDPTSSEAIRLKCGALHHLQRNPELIIEMLTELTARDHAPDLDFNLLAATLADEGRRAEAAELLDKRFACVPITKELLDGMLSFAPDEAEPYVEKYIKDRNIEDADMLGWAKAHIAHGNSAGALAILKADFECYGARPLSFPMLTELLYYSQNFSEVISVCAPAFLSDDDTALLSPSVGIPFAMSVARIHPREGAAEMVAQLINTLMEYAPKVLRGSLKDASTSSPVMDYALLRGYVSALEDIHANLTAKKAVDPDNYDPMLFNLRTFK